jgi:predicted nucleic acid-binding protein
VYLIDTNVISEARKGRNANPGVLAFWQAVASTDVYIAVQTIGEIRRGLENIRQRGDEEQTQRLAAWLDTVVTDYREHILDFDLDCAQVWGRLMSPHPQHAIDKQIAAIALIYDLTVVTRNTADFSGLGVRVNNPFR